MIKAITKYETEDGEEFINRAEAEAHIIDQIGEEYDSLVRSAELPHFNFHDHVRLADSLFGTYEKARHIQRFLNKVLGAEDLEEEEDD